MSSQPRRYELIDQPDQQLLEAVHGVLGAHNAAANPQYWRRLDDPAHDARPLNVFSLDEHGRVLGGLLAHTRFSWLRVSLMSVLDAFRGQGIGSELLRAAETEAADRGCRYAYVDTMEYQAPGFYRHRGYQVVGELKDWDSHGHAKYLLTKDLAQVDDSSQHP